MMRWKYYHIPLCIINIAFMAGDQSDWTRATGNATIMLNDVSAARDEAIIDAQLKTIQEIVGVHIDAEAILANEKLIHDNIVVKSEGFIEAYKVVEGSGQVKDGIYSIKIDAKVSEKEILNTLSGNTSEKSILILIKDERSPPSAVPVENVITQSFTEAGLKVFQSAEKANEINIENKFREQLADVGLRYLSRIIIYGEVYFEGEKKDSDYHYARYSGFLKAVQTDTKEIVWDKVIKPVQGIGKDDHQAITNAYNNTAKSFADEAIQFFRKHFRREITVHVEGLRNSDDFSVCSRLLSHLRWVDDFQAGEFNEFKSKFTFKYSYPIDLLAKKLETDNRFVVRKRNSRYLDLLWQHQVVSPNSREGSFSKETSSSSKTIPGSTDNTMMYFIILVCGTLAFVFFIFKAKR